MVDINHFSEQVLAGHALSGQDALELVRLAQLHPYDLFHAAYRVRTAHFGNTVRLCCIVPGKLGGCGEDCKWCAQSATGNAHRMECKRTGADEIVSAGQDAAACNAACMGIVNSGRGPTQRDFGDVLEAVARLKADPKAGKIQTCASLGELTYEQAVQLKQAGVVRYHHNLETSRRFFPNVVTSHTYDQRLETLAAAARAGMRICCGGLFGLGETWEDRIDLAMDLRNTVHPESVPLNFLHPIPGTALADRTPLPALEILTIIAIYRLLLPTTDLRIAGGRGLNLRQLQSWVFYAGGTSTITGRYLTTTGQTAEEDRRMIEDLGLKIVNDWHE